MKIVDVSLLSFVISVRLLMSLFSMILIRGASVKYIMINMIAEVMSLIRWCGMNVRVSAGKEDIMLIVNVLSAYFRLRFKLYS